MQKKKNALRAKKIIFKVSISIFLLAIVLSTGPGFALASKTISNNKINLDLKVNIKNFDKQNRKAFVEDQIVVKYKNDNKAFRVINLPAGTSVEEAVAKYKMNKDVEYAEPNYIAYSDEAPNDPLYSPYQWHMDNEFGSGVNAEEAWKISTGEGVVVAVIDTGVAYEDYEEFIDNPGRRADYWLAYEQALDLKETCFVPGYDFVNNDFHPNDDEGHGTHVAGTIAQSTNNNLGAAGLAYDSCIMPLKALGADGSGSYTDIADAIIFATDNGADIINMSLGGAYSDVTLADAVEYAHEYGVVVVAAAGNESSNAPHYPSSYETVISVGATGYDKSLASYSNYGSDIDVVAPGGDMYENIYNELGEVIDYKIKDLNDDGYPDGILQETFNSDGFNYFFYQGTSMASPHVAGAAALLISYANELGQELTPIQVREALQNTAEDLGEGGWDQYFGYGLIDAYAALISLRDSSTNEAPIAVMNILGELTEYVGLEFDASGSSDADDEDVLTYTWDFGDNSDSVVTTENIIYHSYDEHGVYTVSLSVNDGKGGVNSTTTDISISNVNDIPVAIASTDKSIYYLGDNVIFDASGSSDADGDELTYTWNFGDGSANVTTTTDTIFNSYDKEGSYDVVLTVNDNNGGVATGTLEVRVEPAQDSIVMSIASLVVEYDKNGVVYNGIATIKIVDASSVPLSGVTVSGNWSGLVKEFVSGDTNDLGEIVLDSPTIRKPGSGSFIFAINDIIRDGDKWDRDLSLGTSSVYILR